MPDPSTVLKWTKTDPHGFGQQYAQARELGYQLLHDELLEIADDGTNDFVETEKGPAFNREHVQRSNLRVDTRKWLLSKMLPKIYGNRPPADDSDSDMTNEPAGPV